MPRFAEVGPEERALIPNVMQPSPRNSIKITERQKESNPRLKIE